MPAILPDPVVSLEPRYPLKLVQIVRDENQVTRYGVRRDQSVEVSDWRPAKLQMRPDACCDDGCLLIERYDLDRREEEIQPRMILCNSLALLGSLAQFQDCDHAQGDGPSADRFESFEDFGRAVLQSVDADVRVKEIGHESRLSRFCRTWRGRSKSGLIPSNAFQKSSGQSSRSRGSKMIRSPWRRIVTS